jgi:hypothetical protein
MPLGACHARLDDAPAYFFVHTPWLPANSAGERVTHTHQRALRARGLVQGPGGHGAAGG